MNRSQDNCDIQRKKEKLQMTKSKNAFKSAPESDKNIVLQTSMVDSHFYDQDYDLSSNISKSSSSKPLLKNKATSYNLTSDQEDASGLRDHLEVQTSDACDASFISQQCTNQSTLIDSSLQYSASRKIEIDNYSNDLCVIEIKESILFDTFVKLSEYCDYFGKRQIFEVDWDYINRPDLEITHSYLSDLAYETFLALSLSPEVMQNILLNPESISNISRNSLNEINSKMNKIINDNSIMK